MAFYYKGVDIDIKFIKNSTGTNTVTNFFKTATDLGSIYLTSNNSSVTYRSIGTKNITNIGNKNVYRLNKNIVRLGYGYTADEYTGNNLTFYVSVKAKHTQPIETFIGDTNYNKSTGVNYEVDSNGTIYAVGIFSQIGGVSINNFAKFNGSTWSQMTYPPNYVYNYYSVNSVAIDINDNYYVTWRNNDNASNYASFVAKWDGNVWTIIKNNDFTWINYLAAAPNGGIYAAGVTTILATNTNDCFVMKWNGTTWSDINSAQLTSLYTYDPTNGSLGYYIYSVRRLAIAEDGTIYISLAVWVNTIDGAIHTLAKFNGTTWSRIISVDSNSFDSIYGIATGLNGSLYLLGFLYLPQIHTSDQLSGGFPYYLYKWDGTNWSLLATGSGPRNPTIITVKVLSDNSIYLCGTFTHINNVLSNGFAKFDGTTWIGMGPPATNGSNGIGNGTVRFDNFVASPDLSTFYLSGVYYFTSGTTWRQSTSKISYTVEWTE